MITSSKQISTHFHSSEFKCQHCNKIKIDEKLVQKMENIFSRLNASKCIISSGYRCPTYDVQIGGFAGRHSEGLAADCCYYDKNGKIIPSKIVICVAYDLGELNGIAKINNNYVHLDNRSGSTYRGDETKGNSSYWTNPYTYFGVSKSDVAKYTGESTTSKKSNEEVAKEVIDGKWGNGEERKNRLTQAGYNYSDVQAIVNKLLSGNKVTYLSNTSYKGTSIVDALNQIKVDSSYNYRSKLAKANGITNYTGTSNQNTQLLNLLKKGKLIKA